MPPYITSQQMSEVDRLAVEKYNLPVLDMMNQAGKRIAEFVKKLKLKPKKIVVFFGKGNNGGGGLSAARKLSENGFEIEIVAADLKVNENVKYHLSALSEMGIKPVKDFKAKEGDLIIDALLGYNIKGAPKGRYGELIKGINLMKKSGMKVISLDIPSGLDPNTGTCNEICVKPNYTLTLALPKIGLKKAKLKNLYLANIGISIKLYKELNISVEENLFAKDNIVKI